MKKHLSPILIFYLLFIAGVSFSQPHTEWIRQYTSDSTRDDYPVDMVTDKEGNIYVTGYTIMSFSNYDFVTLKYNNNGNLQWVRTYDGPANGHDKPVGIEIDDSNFIYVGGTSQDTGGNYNVDYFIIKYNELGDTLWTRRYNTFGGINNADVASAIAMDKYNNILITGSGGSPCFACPSGYMTVKYNSGGELQWTRFYKSPPAATDIPYYIATDKNNNVYVTGNPSNSRALTIKYNSNGDSLWIRQLNFGSVGTIIQVDDSSIVYLAGVGFFIAKYDSSGNLLWTRTRDGSLGDLKIDNTYSIYICGSVPGNMNSDYITVKMNGAGDTIWSKKYFYNSFSNDEANSMVLDSVSNIFVTGISERNSISYGMATIMYDSSGNQKWVIRYDNPIFGLSSGTRKIKKDEDDNIIVLGQSQSISSGWDIIVIKYSQLTDIQQISSIISHGFKLCQNYPNPFNSSTTIKYEIPVMSNVKIQLFDETGKEILEMINENHSPGEYEVKLNGNNLASGIYFFRLTSNGNIVDTKKLILLK